MNRDFDPRPLRPAWVSSQTLARLADAIAVLADSTPYPAPFFDLLALAGFPCEHGCRMMPDVRSHFLHHLFRINWSSYHEALAMMPIIETVIAMLDLKSLESIRESILDSITDDGIKLIEGKLHRRMGSRMDSWEQF